jgi:hypothetical protein
VCTPTSRAANRSGRYAGRARPGARERLRGRCGPQKPRARSEPVAPGQRVRASMPVAPADIRKRSPAGSVTGADPRAYGRRSRPKRIGPCRGRGMGEAIGWGIAPPTRFGVPCRDHGRMPGRALIVSPAPCGWDGRGVPQPHATVACGPGGGMPVSRVDTTGGWRRSGGAHTSRREAEGGTFTAKAPRAPRTATAEGG